MFNRLKDKQPVKPKSSGKEDHALLPVKRAKTLLKDQRFHMLVQKIKNHSRLSDKKFKHLYVQTLFQFAEFVQELPVSATGKLAEPGSALHLSIERAEIALGEYQNYLKSIDAYPEKLSAEHELWNFVTFSSALMKDVAHVALAQTVALFDENQKLTTLWSPYHGSMVQLDAHYYNQRFRHDHRDALSPSALPLFAERLLAEEGRALLARFPEAMSTWLALLNADEGDVSGSGGLLLRLLLWSDYIARARLHVIEHDASFSAHAYVEDDLIRKADKEARFGEQVGGGLAGEESTSELESEHHLEDDEHEKASVKDKQSSKSKTKEKVKDVVKVAGASTVTSRRYDMKDGKPTKQKTYVDLGAEFTRWLQVGVEKGAIKVNQAGAQLHVTPQGMLLVSQNLLKTFAATLNNPVHWQVVVNQLAGLAFCVLNTNGRFSHTGLKAGQQSVEGLLVRNAKAILANAKPASDFQLKTNVVNELTQSTGQQLASGPGSAPAGF